MPTKVLEKKEKKKAKVKPIPKMKVVKEEGPPPKPGDKNHFVEGWCMYGSALDTLRCPVCREPLVAQQMKDGPGFPCACNNYGE